MGQTTDQIERHIANRREDLQSNMQELQSSVKSATDWRFQFRKHPGPALAAAFCGGILLARLFGRSRVQLSALAPEGSAAAGSQTSRVQREALDAWSGIKMALLGVATSQFKHLLAAAVPGFSDELAKSARKARVRSERSGL